MSFQFPSSIDAVKLAQDLYRVRALVVAETISSDYFGLGDILQIKSGISAIAVGPDSAYENYEIVYSDPAQDLQIQNATLSKSAPLFLPVSSTGVDYPGTEQEGNILLRPLDPPIDFVGTQFILDVLVYLGGSRPPLTATVRNPVIGSLALDLTAGQDFLTSYPGYGRRFFEAAINLSSALPAGSADITIHGYKFVTDWGVNAGPGTPVTFQRAFELLSTNLATGATLDFVHDAYLKGFFDRYTVNMDPDFSHDPSANNVAYQNAVLFYSLRDC